MRYFAITRETASWVLNQPELISDLASILGDERQLLQLRNADMLQGPARLTGTQDGSLLGFWNGEYLSGVGQEAWGFLRVSSPLGLHDARDISRRVLQTELEIIRLRLDALKLDAKLIHRNWGDGISSTRADRGDAGSYLNLAYVEDYVEIGQGQAHTILILGPAHDFRELVDAARGARADLKRLNETANELLLPRNRRPVLEQQISLQQPLTHEREKSSFEAATVLTTQIPDGRKYQTVGWTFREWVSSVDTLSREQRHLFDSDLPLEHPVRIVGRAGSGKSLVMQLMTIKHLRAARDEDRRIRVLYVVHNSSMGAAVKERFEILAESSFLEKESLQQLEILTLSQYALSHLKVDERAIIDKDAEQTKQFQRTVVEDCLRDQLRDESAQQGGEVFSTAGKDATSFALCVDLIVGEISTAIKGHGLVRDRQRYVYGEQSLSRLHRIMKEDDRAFVFDVFRRYHERIFEREHYLDADDIAISLVSDLETPVWDLRRRSEGYDIVFVDETQLFNENERRAFALITKGDRAFQPVALALDEAQEFFGQTTAGFASLGIEGLSEERLSVNQRSTEEIIRLAFFIIQQSTDLLTGDFPVLTYSRVPSDFPKCIPPRIESAAKDSKNIGRATAKKISELRTRNIQRIAVVCHADVYWEILTREINAWGAQRSERVVHLLQRGEVIANGPSVVLTKPAYVGGQEFEAVICVGLEQGLVPPKSTNRALEIALAQQALREMYLAVSRAQYQVLFLLAAHASPNEVLQLAISEGYVDDSSRVASNLE